MPTLDSRKAPYPSTEPGSFRHIDFHVCRFTIGSITAACAPFLPDEEAFGASLSWLWHFALNDGCLPIRLGKGVARKPCWNRRCSALFLSDHRATNCHCCTSSGRSRVIDFAIRFELLGDTIVRRLDLQSALKEDEWRRFRVPSAAP